MGVAGIPKNFDRARDLTALFERHLPAIIAALEHNSLVELDRQTIQVIM